MAGAKEIKNRIKSVQSTHQITKAMEIVSTTKFKRFSALVVKSRPFAESIQTILSIFDCKNESFAFFAIYSQPVFTTAPVYIGWLLKSHFFRLD